MAKKVAKPKTKTEVAKPIPPEQSGLLDNDQDVIILPRIDILQALSPAVVDGDGSSGEIVNNLTQEVIEKPVFVPLFVRQNFIRWKPREEGGGMVYKTSDANDPRVKEDVKWGADGEKPRCTRYLNFLVLLEGDDLPIVLSFHDTGYQVGRGLYTMLKTGQMRGHRNFDVRYELSSMKTKNDKGTFFVPRVKRVGPSDGETKKVAEHLFNEFYTTNFTFDEERRGEETAGEDESEF